MTQRPRSGHSTLRSSKRFSWRVLKELADVYMDNMPWMKALKKDSIHKKIMATRDDYVDKDMFDQAEAMAATVDKRKFLLKRLLKDRRRFPEQ